jgi:hypothetical protein
MATKEQLHHLIDLLPEEAVDTAAHVLEALGRPTALYTRETAPLDDEPETEAERAAVAEARADIAAGRVSPAADVFRRLGL